MTKKEQEMKKNSPVPAKHERKERKKTIVRKRRKEKVEREKVQKKEV